MCQCATSLITDTREIERRQVFNFEALIACFHIAGNADIAVTSGASYNPICCLISSQIPPSRLQSRVQAQFTRPHVFFRKYLSTLRASSPRYPAGTPISLGGNLDFAHSRQIRRRTVEALGPSNLLMAII